MPATAGKNLIYFYASLALSAAALIWLFSSVSPAEVLEIVIKADRRAVLCFIALSLGTSLLRMLRYRLLLGMSGQKPAALPLFLVVLVRNLFSDLLPARLGTLIYIYLANARLGATLSSATSSFALAFLFDILAIAPIALYAACSSLSSEGLLSTFNLVSAAIIIGAGSAVMIQMLPWCFGKAAAAFRLLPGAMQPQRVQLLLQEVQAELRRIRQAGIYARVFALSVGVRLGKYLTLYAFLLALLLPRGFQLQDLAFSRVFPGLCAAELAASLPVSGIAGLGAYQGAWIFTFTLLGFEQDIATLTSLAHHLFTQAWGYSLGVLALLILLLPFGRRPGR